MTSSGASQAFLRERALAYMREQEAESIEALAQAMHEYVCGSWEAAGHITKEAFREAGAAAYGSLRDQGFDLFSFPEGGWGTVS